MRHAQKQHQANVTKCDEPTLRMGFNKAKSPNQPALRIGLTHEAESLSMTLRGRSI